MTSNAPILLGLLALLVLVSLGATSCKKGPVQEAINYKDTVKEAYVYAFPMLMNYAVMYQYSVDRNSGQFKAPFNQIHNEARVFTPKDTAVVTPNSDTPYSMLWLDLRAEPIVLCVPKIDKNRYHSIQLVDSYTFNYGYVSNRATGNAAGCYLVAGPDWHGDTPKGIQKVFHSETQFSAVVYRTQLFNPDDMNNVKKIQVQYTAQPLSEFLHLSSPPAAPAIDFPAFTKEDMKIPFPVFLNFILQFCPPVEEEITLRAKFAKIGFQAGKPFSFEKLSETQKAEFALGLKEGYDAIEKQKNNMGKNINGWSVGAAFGDRSFYKGDYTLRAAAALAGIYGNNAEEAMYPMAKTADDGQPLDGSKHNYTLNIPAGQFPPVNAFWSVTMYDGKTQLLIENPINRYLINSPMLPAMKKNKDGSLTIYIQKDPPNPDHMANWLPAPDGPIYLVMRLYWPKDKPSSILDGTWQVPPIKKVL